VTTARGLGTLWRNVISYIGIQTEMKAEAEGLIRTGGLITLGLRVTVKKLLLILKLP